MKIAFHILALVALGVALYFSLAHKEKFENQQQTRLTTIDTNRQVVASTDVANKNIRDERDLLAQSVERRDTLEASVMALTSTGNTLKIEVTELDATIASQKEEIAKLEKILEEVQLVAREFGEDVTIDNLPERVKSLEDERDSRKEKLDELETLVAAAEKSVAAKRAEGQRLAERKMARNTRLSRNAMEAVVTAVNHEWGFLVIGAGSNSGFAPQRELLIKRDGRLIGRVKPSAIEPNQTIAEIDLDTIAPGARIQPGDRVILATPTAN
jgi:hypothetical protein